MYRLKKNSATSASQQPIRRSFQKYDGEQWIFDNRWIQKGFSPRHSIKNKDFQIVADNSEYAGSTVLQQIIETDFCGKPLNWHCKNPYESRSHQNHLDQR